MTRHPRRCRAPIERILRATMHWSERAPLRPRTPDSDRRHRARRGRRAHRLPLRRRRPPRRSRPSPTDGRPESGPPVEHRVTLVTGDVVHVSTGSDGRQSVTLEPRPDGSIPQAAINQVHDHLYVVPVEAFGLLAAHRLDRDLFDVTAPARARVRRRLDAASLPVIVDYGRGPAAAAESRAASFAGAERTVTVPRLGVTAFHADKTAPGPSGPTSPRAMTTRATRRP